MEHDKLLVSMALRAWESRVIRTQQLLAGLSDERLAQEIAPGKNRGLYLMGHLVAYHDAMCTILDLGPRLYPELDAAFLQHPDKSGLATPPVAELRHCWAAVHQRLAVDFHRLPPTDWFTRHTAISEAEFRQEPHRNKLGVLLNRTNHLAYHTGQLLLLR